MLFRSAAAAIIHDREAAEAPAVDELDGLVNRRVHVDADDVGLHDVVDARAEIGEERGRVHVESLECEINARVRRPAACGEHVFPAGEALQIRAADGRAD